MAVLAQNRASMTKSRSDTASMLLSNVPYMSSSRALSLIHILQIGEYKKGSDKEADDALARINAVNAFLRQGLDEKSTFEETLQALYKVVA